MSQSCSPAPLDSAENTDLTLFPTLGLFLANTDTAMWLLPVLMSWGWIQVQEGDLAADPPELCVAQDTPSVFQTYFCNLWPELEKYLKTAGNMEICFKSSVFYTKNKNSKQCFSLSQTTYNICMHTFWLN